MAGRSLSFVVDWAEGQNVNTTRLSPWSFLNNSRGFDGVLRLDLFCIFISGTDICARTGLLRRLNVPVGD